MPLRVLLTGKLHGPDMAATMILLHRAGRCGIVVPETGFVRLDERFKLLREIQWDVLNKDQPLLESAATLPN